ncbi:FAD/NAD(P)-binding domain-containing protein [Mycena amicta]|nr:FAD/NAD(P)-binding domain-containing protein [Mycena amicta]
MSKVIIAGCGIAGPVLALLLKQKGYAPVIYERGGRAPAAGLSLMLQPNGLKVLSLIPGLIERLPGKTLDKIKLISILPSDERVLAQSDSPTALRSDGGFGMVGVNRPRFLALLADIVEEAGIPMHFDTPVVGIGQLDGGDVVLVHLGTGDTDSAPLVVGCDGLHSAVRVALFGEQKSVFTGLTQTGGVTPNMFADSPPTMVQFYGDNLHVITYPISESGEYSWALTQRGPEAKETWRAMDAAAQDAFRTSAFSQLPSGVGELVRRAQKITKYGLYDRPQLKSWHKGRVVLIGDAAHPTSPHLGQGANQAFEDAYHLSQLLDGSDLSLASLSAIFTAFETERMERTAELVRAARETGELRVVAGEEAAKRRNELLSLEGVGKVLPRLR